MCEVAGHGGVKYYCEGAPYVGKHRSNSSEAFQKITCPHCDRDVVAAVLAAYDHAPSAKWLRCPGCGKGSTINDNALTPSPLPGEMVDGLPADVDSAFKEARRSLGASAYTASELMCRKILMHVAVDKHADPGKTFAYYLNYLESQGHLTPPMKPWVDMIRQNGNIATHEIPATDEHRALTTLSFTTQLLRLVYEMTHKLQQSTVGSVSSSDSTGALGARSGHMTTSANHEQRQHTATT